jgi:hypothetical protein
MKSFLQLFLLSLLIIICVFFYNKYFTEKKVIKKIEVETVIENDSLEKKNNIIQNLKYNVELLDGGKYEITANKSEIIFNDGKETVLMNEVIASFTDIKNNKIKILSDNAKFNSENYNTYFSENVEISFEDSLITSDKIDFDFINNNILIYKNVIYINDNGNMRTDNISINLITKQIDIFMNNSKKKVRIATN